MIGLELPEDLIETIRRSDVGARISLARTEADLGLAVKDADVLFTWAVPDAVPHDSPNLKWIQLISAGADHLRQRPVWNSDIVITSSKGIHAVPIAEHVFAMILAFTRQLNRFERAQQRHDWRPRGSSLRPIELYGKTLGMIGWGGIGDGVAHLAHAFGMRVIGIRRSLQEPMPTGAHSNPLANPPATEPPMLEPDIAYPADRLLAVLAESDVVVVALPDTPETAGLLGARELEAMKPGAILVNVGRGRAVDENALIHALQANGTAPSSLAGAALDVFVHEPLPPRSPLWDMPNVIITPHVAGASPETRARSVHLFCDNLARYIAGQPLLNTVDRHQGY